ncbi:hypothetical protein JXA32_04020 [Candidatus Sumerlaeota bacterium]|nr:hypothetical protein [Candidatus Sumerlaeota bacterium]
MTLIEVITASGITALVFLVTISALSVHRVQQTKQHQHNVMLNYAIHYLELVEGLDFAEIKKGAPINALYDGNNGAPGIFIPNNNAWIDLTANDYLVFQPELAWMSSFNPEMQVVLTVTQDSGEDYSKHLSLVMRWDAPLGRGGQLSKRMDLVRMRDG